MALPVRLFGALAFLSIACAGCTPSAALSDDAEVGTSRATRTVPLEIHTAKGVIHFEVEVAATPQEQARGLMYRASLPERGGMIFPMTPPRFASFWMKNTYIPLDLIFIRTDGTISSIAAQAVPENLSPIESREPVAAVLEIAGGGAAAHGIAVGDRVSWKLSRPAR